MTTPEEEIAGIEWLNDKMAAQLHRVANAVNGPPPPRTAWSFHDLGEKVEALAGQRERFRAALRLLYPDDITPAGRRVLEKILDAETAL